MEPVVITRTDMTHPQHDGLTIRWGHDMDTRALQLGIWYRGRCVQVGFEAADRDLPVAVFYHRFIRPALHALAAARLPEGSVPAQAGVEGAGEVAA